MRDSKTFWPFCCLLLIALQVGSARADTARQEFTVALHKWQAAGMHDYRFTLFQSCFCPGGQPLRITVQNDRVLRVTNVRDGTDALPEAGVQAPTMDEIFQKIEAAYAKPADHIRLTLNAEYGYPEEVFIDYVAMMADEELRYSISDFAR
jgi:hypothetical protein